MPHYPKFIGQQNSQQGQTLIETLAAAFILVMGVSAAVGLAMYALGSSTNITKQIIATGLAREGVEAVKNMRDTNWLQQRNPVTTCYNYVTGAQDAKCYTDWLGDSNLNTVAYCLNPTNNNGNCNGNGSVGGSMGYLLKFDKTSAPYWVLNNAQGNYGLLLNTAPGNSGLYSTGIGSSGVQCSDSVAGISDYCRKIIITLNFDAPYDHPHSSPGNPKYDASDIGPLVQVQSIVWWKDKKCPRSNDVPSDRKCAVELDTYLTNWKNW